MIKTLKEVFTHFIDNDTFTKGAALAYYAVFSIIPIIMIVTSVLGLVFGEEAVSGQIYEQLKEILGSSASLQIQEFIKNQYTSHHSLITSIIGFFALALTATGMFSQIHSSFNSMWGIKAKPKSSILNFISMRLVSFIVLILLFLIIILSTTLSSVILKYAQSIQQIDGIVYLYEHLVTILVLSLIFAILFKYLGDAKVHFKAALLGGLFTSVLFTIGKIGIGMYIGHSHISTTFGSASVLALLMIWIYYTSQIIFLGASFVKAISINMGCEILPNTNAVKIEHLEVPSSK